MRPVPGYALRVLNLAQHSIDGVIQGHLKCYRSAMDPAKEDLELAQGQTPLADTRRLRAPRLLRIDLPIDGTLLAHTTTHTRSLVPLPRAMASAQQMVRYAAVSLDLFNPVCGGPDAYYHGPRRHELENPQQEGG